jgi:YHS domain-containing protein
MKTTISLTVALVAVLFMATTAVAGSPPHSQAATDATPAHRDAQEHAAKTEPANPKDADVIAQQKPVYPLDTCVVLGNKLGEEATDYVYKGRLVRFCCKDCIATFEKDPAKYLAKLDEATKAKEKSKTGASTPKSTGEAGQGSHKGH